MKQKTVGILTFHRALNYGAVLQAYALKWVCGEMGCDAHIIDYDYDAGAVLAGLSDHALPSVPQEVYASPDRLRSHQETAEADDVPAGGAEAAGMMKKKILFSCYGLGIGGIEKCLVNLINALPEEQYEVDLLLMNPEYDFREQLRRPVRFLPLFDYVANVHDTMPEIRRRGGVLRNTGLALRWIMFRLELKFGRKPWRWFRPLPEHYDVAIAYSQNDYSAYYVIDKVKADRKVFWYHNGAYTRSGWAYERDKVYYPKFDYTVAVSTDCAGVLRERFDFAPGRLIVLRNICEAASIRDRAEAFIPDSFRSGRAHIVSVGRMTAEKGAPLAVEACRMLRDRGFDICWHWVGDGNQCDAIRQSLAQYGLQGEFILEGNQENPYPYLKNADVYVQPSHYEAYSTTITEAKVLGRPIVTTDVGGMRDQLADGENGLIVPIDAAAIAEAVERLLTDETLCSSFAERLRSEDFSPEKTLREYEQRVFAPV